MTAIRHFANAPRAPRAAAPWRWQTPGWLLSAWRALERYGYRRAAFHLELEARQRASSNPTLASQLTAAAAECRRAAMPAPAGSTS